MIFEIQFVNDIQGKQLLHVEAPEKSIMDLTARLSNRGKFQTFKAIAPFDGEPINDIIINTDNISNIKLVGKKFAVTKFSDKADNAHIE